VFITTTCFDPRRSLSS